MLPWILVCNQQSIVKISLLPLLLMHPLKTIKSHKPWVIVTVAWCMWCCSAQHGAILLEIAYLRFQILFLSKQPGPMTADCFAPWWLPSLMNDQWLLLLRSAFISCPVLLLCTWSKGFFPQTGYCICMFTPIKAPVSLLYNVVEHH